MSSSGWCWQNVPPHISVPWGDQSAHRGPAVLARGQQDGGVGTVGTRVASWPPGQAHHGGHHQHQDTSVNWLTASPCRLTARTLPWTWPYQGPAIRRFLLPELRKEWDQDLSLRLPEVELNIIFVMLINRLDCEQVFTSVYICKRSLILSSHYLLNLIFSIS